MADVVSLAEVDEVYDRLSRKEEERVDDFDLRSCKQRFPRESCVKLSD